MNPSSPATGPQRSAEKRGRSKRDERSRSRERAHPRSSSQNVDEDSATVDPKSRVRDRSVSPQEQEGSRRQDPQQKGKKTFADKQPSEPPKAKKHRSIDSDEHEEEPQHKYFLVIQVMKTVNTAMKKSAQSRDSENALYHSDLYVLTNDEHWTVTPETHKYAAAAGSFCFPMTENGEQQDMCNLIITPCVQRSLYLSEVTNDFENRKVEVPEGVDGQTRDTLERCMTTCGRAAGTRAKMRSRARKEASAQEVRGYYKQFAEAKNLEYRSCGDNEAFDLIDMRKVKPRNYVTGRWVLAIKTDKKGNFFRPKARWVLRGFQDKQKEYLQTDPVCFHKTRISD